MSITLGRVPEKLKVPVTRDGNFAASFRRADGENWPAEVSLVLDFGSVEWVSETDGASIGWRKTGDEVNALLATRPRGVQLWYRDSSGAGGQVLWASGDVSERD